MILTFDDKGVSSHPNHISTHHAVTQLFNEREFPVDVLVLHTVNIARKYIGWADAHFASPNDMYYSNLFFWESFFALKEHWTQFVWFRLLFVWFSRYGYINTLDWYSHKKEAAADKNKKSDL